jgi:uncharacterized linocin/CFP29 family protein
MPIQNGRDFFSSVGGLGSLLNANGDIELKRLRPVYPMVQNATLTRDEWLDIDAVVLETFRTGLTGVNDLINAGLSRPSNLGVILSGYPVVGDMEAAQMSMDGVVHGQQDNLEYDENFVPIPITHKDFGLSARQLLVSRQGRGMLETDHIREAAKKVRDLNESVLFNGTGNIYSGYPIYGYTSHPNRATDTAANYGGGDFGTSGNAYKTFVGAINAMAALGFNGPWGIYAANTQYGQLLNQYGSNDNNELKVILDTIPDIAFIKRSFDLAAASVVMVQLTRDVIDLEVAQGITTVQWMERGGFLSEYRIMDALVPRIKKDKNNRVGICHITAA